LLQEEKSPWIYSKIIFKTSKSQWRLNQSDFILAISIPFQTFNKSLIQLLLNLFNRKITYLLYSNKDMRSNKCLTVWTQFRIQIKNLITTLSNLLSVKKKECLIFTKSSKKKCKKAWKKICTINHKSKTINVINGWKITIIRIKFMRKGYRIYP
jgi:hypothetical protein